jgi:hypothetical protein
MCRECAGRLRLGGCRHYVQPFEALAEHKYPPTFRHPSLLHYRTPFSLVHNKNLWQQSHMSALPAFLCCKKLGKVRDYGPRGSCSKNNNARKRCALFLLSFLNPKGTSIANMWCECAGWLRQAGYSHCVEHFGAASEYEYPVAICSSLLLYLIPGFFSPKSNAARRHVLFVCSSPASNLHHEQRTPWPASSALATETTSLSLQKLHRYQPMCAPSYIFFSRCKRVGQELCGASVLPETCFRHRTYVLSLALRGLRGDINQHSFFSALVFFITLQTLLYPNLNLGGICPLCQLPSAEQRCEEATMGRRHGYCSRKDFGFIRCVLLRLSQWISKDYTTHDMSCELDCLGKISPTQ